MKIGFAKRNDKNKHNIRKRKVSKNLPKIIAILLIVLFVGGFLFSTNKINRAEAAGATTYYVSVADGNDSYDGTEQTHTTGNTGPWKTIAKVNSSSFNPGDSILFKSGETWREQLTVPSSGMGDSSTSVGSGTSGKGLFQASSSIRGIIENGDATFLYGIKDQGANFRYLYRYTSVADLTGTAVYDFGSSSWGVNEVFTTNTAGLIFVLANKNTAGINKYYLFKSIDYGAHFGNNAPTFDNGSYVLIFGDTDGTEAHQISNVYTLFHGFAENTITGDLYVGEYNINGSRTAGSTNDKVRLMKSTDSGTTWAEVAHWNTDGSHNNVRHIHAVQYNSGNVYISFGDFDVQSGILKWDGTSSVASNANLSTYSNCWQGAQHYRTSMLLFPVGDYAYYSVDSGDSPAAQQGIWKIKKDFTEDSTRVDSQITAFPGHSGWHGTIAADGTIIFTEFLEADASPLTINFYTSMDNGATWQIFSKTAYNCGLGIQGHLFAWGNYVLYPYQDYSLLRTLVLTTTTATPNVITNLANYVAGASTNAIDFGSYGTGVAPIINGTTLIAPGTSWDADAGSTDIGDKTAVTSTTFVANYIYMVGPWNSGTGGTVNSISIKTMATVSTQTKMALYTDNSGAPNALVANSVTDELNQTANSINVYTYSGTRPTLAPGTNYWMAIISASNTTTPRDGYGSGLAFGYGYKAQTYSSGFLATITSPTMAPTVSKLYWWMTIGTAQANTWNNSLSTQPDAVWFNGTLGTLAASKATVDATNKWYWASNVLSVYSTSDPDTAYTSPGIEARTLDYAVTTNAKTNIIINNIMTKAAKTANIRLNGATRNELNYCLSLSGITGVLMDNATVKVQNCVIYGNTTGIDVNAAGTITNTIVNGNTTGLDEVGATAIVTFSVLQTSHTGAGNITNDPLFVSTSTPDFHLQSTSPAINAGTSVGLTRDYAGNTVPNCSNTNPDIGAYEYQDTCLVTGGASVPGLSNPPIPGTNGFKCTINNNDTKTKTRDVTLTLEAGPNVRYYSVSEKPDLKRAGFDSFEPEVILKPFTLSPGDGLKTVYAQFMTAYNRLSDIVSDDIILDSSTIATGSENQITQPTQPAQSNETPKDSNLSIADGDLIKAANNPDVYIVKLIGDKKFKRLILNPDIFNQYKHLKWENIKTVSQEVLDQYVISDLVRAVKDPKVYKLYANGDTGKKNGLKP